MCTVYIHINIRKHLWHFFAKINVTLRWYCHCKTNLNFKILPFKLQENNFYFHLIVVQWLPSVKKQQCLCIYKKYFTDNFELYFIEIRYILVLYCVYLLKFDDNVWRMKPVGILNGNFNSFLLFSAKRMADSICNVIELIKCISTNFWFRFVFCVLLIYLHI